MRKYATTSTTNHDDILIHLPGMRKVGNQYRGASCPMCGSRSGLAIRYGRKAILAHCHACKSPGDRILAAARIGGAIRSPARLGDRPLTPEKETQTKRQAIDRVLGQCYPARSGDPVCRYLDCRRILPDEHEGIPPVLLFHPRLPYHEDGQTITYYPGMIAKLEDKNECLVTLHRTYLTHDSRKAPVASPKKLMSPATPGATRGAAIHLDEAGRVLVIAEGIETSMWIRKECKWPVWAAYCADGMRHVQVPEHVERVYIFPDTGDVGMRAAQDAATRLTKEGFTVKVMPPKEGRDWDDFLSEDGL